jgi:chloramphenicol-sensitive protein RarD
VPPLMLFALAARRVSLSTIGVLQYIGPTLQFLLGVLVLGEAFGPDRFVGFALVWVGSAIYIAGAHRAFRQSRLLAPA